LNFQKDYEGVKTFRLEQIVLLKKYCWGKMIIEKNKVKLDKSFGQQMNMDPR
jgi:hypothetical protein